MKTKTIIYKNVINNIKSTHKIFEQLEKNMIIGSILIEEISQTQKMEGTFLINKREEGKIDKWSLINGKWIIFEDNTPTKNSF